MDYGARDLFDADVLATVGALRSATVASACQAMARNRDVVSDAIERLVDDGKIVRIRLKKTQKAFAYELPEQEAAE